MTSFFGLQRMARYGWILLLPILLSAGAAGCRGKKDDGGNVLAQVGSRELTKKDFQELCGAHPDSLHRFERWRSIENWIERTLMELEGEKRDLEKRPDVALKLHEMRAELFSSLLLSELPADPPADSAVERYYENHRGEFLRPVDAYQIELFWAEHQNIMARFRDQIQRGDTSMVAAGDVTAEGKWLAESRELDHDLERELSSMKPGEATFPRPYEDGFRIVRLLETYPAGTVLDLSVVREEIVARLLFEQSRARQDSLITSLRERYPVRIFVRDSL
ncbi:peptidyl-prolyl cis-trans isomerase [candidate division KSB1 bacterium]|nr:MAG: peptidyl-prolyl cis-trans isomerase [candidate division KSB1 bacterium]